MTFNGAVAGAGGGVGACDGGVWAEQAHQSQTLRAAQPAGHQRAGAYLAHCKQRHTPLMLFTLIEARSMDTNSVLVPEHAASMHIKISWLPVVVFGPRISSK
eukprot:1161284-Pelagomonas_calceolata.AAC.4